jgi:tRNA pseudouridine55 synthase
LAYDFGLSVNSGAHLSSLRRTKIGEFSVNNALSINQFIEKLELE